MYDKTKVFPIREPEGGGGGGGDVTAAGNNTFTGVNTFENNVNLGNSDSIITVNGTLKDGDGNEYVTRTDYASSTDAGVVKVGAGLYVNNAGQLITSKAPLDQIKAGENQYNVIVSMQQHQSTFYGLSKAAGANLNGSDAGETAPDGTNPGVYPDTAKTAIREMLGAAGTEELESGAIVPKLADEAAHAETADEAASLQTSVGVTDETPFAAQPVGGSSDVTTTYQKLNKLVACNVVKNQLVDTSFTGNEVSFSDDGYLTVTNTTGGNIYRALSTNRNFVKDHKYLIFLSKVDKDESVIAGPSYFTIANTVVNITTSSILTPANDHTGAIGFVFGQSTVANSYYKAYIYIVDLTLRYGSNDVVNAIIGSDLSKYVEKLIAFDPNILKDTDYETGSFSECKTAELLTIDYNQWDEEWENGSYYTSSGGKETTSDWFRNKTPIRILPSTKYYFKKANSSNLIALFYDIDGNYLGNTYNVGYISLSSGTDGVAFITPTNAYFCNITSHSTTYNHDICIFLYWDGSRIGYEPYKEHRYPMPNVAGHGILKVVNGKVVADGDVMTPDGSGNQTRYAKITFTGASGESWNRVGTKQFACSLSSSDLSSYTVRSASSNRFLYSVESYGSLVPGIVVNAGNLIVRFPDLAEDSVSAFQTWLSSNNLTVIYLLAKPTTLTAPTFTSTFYGDDFGTMWWLDEDGNVIDGLQGNEIFYKANVSGFAESMYIEADGDPEYFAAASQLTDTALNARGYYKMEDLSSEIVDSANLTYVIKKAYRIGNIVTVTVRATNSTTITAGTQLMTFGSNIYNAAGSARFFADVSGTNAKISVNISGIVTCDTEMPTGSALVFTASYAVA